MAGMGLLKLSDHWNWQTFILKSKLYSRSLRTGDWEGAHGERGGDGAPPRGRRRHDRGAPNQSQKESQLTKPTAQTAGDQRKQKGTKTDVAVWFTDADGNHHQTSLEYSVKAAAVKQFSQRGGTKFETLVKLFEEFYSYQLEPWRLPYAEHMNAQPQRIPEALSLAYNKAWASMGSGSPRSFTAAKKTQFAAAVKYHAQKLVGDMPQLNLLDTGQPDIKDFNLMAKNIATYGYWSVEQTFSKSKLANAMLPKHIIRIHKDSQAVGAAILEIRVRVETQKSGNLYFRSVIENGKDMGILVGYLGGVSLSEREKYLA